VSVAVGRQQFRNAELRFYTAWVKTDDGAVITAENIRDKPQPPQLFEMPVGLARFDPRALIEQIKQSDVWVEEPRVEQQAHP